jgi:hypothetical protein
MIANGRPSNSRHREEATVVTRAGVVDVRRRSGAISRLNTDWHKPALMALAAVVLVHWVEHIAQVVQIWLLHYKKPDAHGLIGAQWPWLVTSETLHYVFAALMLLGLAILLPAFHGRARLFWIIALAIQTWHFIEHQILLIQAQTHPWFGAKVPTSVLQQFWPMSRPELHLVYNTLVTIPMIVAIYFHLAPPLPDRGRMSACTCVIATRRFAIET